MSSITNGWDAICAYDAGQLNDVFLQQFLLQTQTTDALNIRAMMLDPGGAPLLLDVQLGPPEISFPADLSTQQLQATMVIISGQIIEFQIGNPGVINSVLNVSAPPQSVITGPVTIEKVPGTDNLGTVVLNLAAGAWDVSLQGIVPGSPVSTALGAALQSYFANVSTQYTIATVAQSDLPPALTPTSFELYLQASDTAGDGALLLLIQTTGSGGTVGPLAGYPIPSGSDSAVIVSNDAVMNGVMLTGLNAEVAPLGVAFAYDAGSETLSVASGSPLYMMLQGQFGQSVIAGMNIPAPVQVPFGVTVQYSNGAFELVWSQDVFANWETPAHDAGPASAIVTWSVTGEWSVDPKTGIVSLPSPGVPGVAAADTSTFSSDFQQALQAELNELLQEFSLPQIDTFILSNLLFANANAFLPATASMPYDLVVTGNIAPGLQLSPASATLAVTAGATQTWTVTQNGTTVDPCDVMWQVSWGPGSFRHCGVYVPAASAPMPAIVVVTATLSSDFSFTGSALLIVYEPQPATAVTIDPPVIGLASSSYTFNASTAVTVSISPQIGTITTVSDTSFTYTTPDTLDAPQQVTITATSTSDPSQSGTAIVNLLTTDATITVQLNSTNEPCSAGHYALFGASSQALDSFNWASYPPGFGSLVPTSANGSTATYYAPQSAATIPPQGVQVTICAYGNDGSTAGVASINLYVVQSATATRTRRRDSSA